MKKRKQEILRKKEQSTVQSTEQYTEQPTVQSTIQPNDTYIYGVGMLAVLAIGICVFYKYNSNYQKDVICFRSDDEKTLYNK